MSGGLLIIGSSQAGVQLAVSLRALGYAEPITLLGDENHRPYQRPALSKEYLQGKVSKESLIYRAQDYWEGSRIQVVRNERILRIDKSDDGSGIAHSMSGAEFPLTDSRSRWVPELASCWSTASTATACSTFAMPTTPSN